MLRSTLLVAFLVGLVAFVAVLVLNGFGDIVRHISLRRRYHFGIPVHSGFLLIT